VAFYARFEGLPYRRADVQCLEKEALIVQVCPAYANLQYVGPLQETLSEQ
jgi:hypothetical protein